MKKEKLFNYSFAFLLPIVLLSIVYLILRMIPFGNETLLTTDMNSQYMAFFSYLKDSLLGDSSLFYSFSKTMSGEMVGLTGYYLMSPFNLLFLLFPQTSFPLAVMIITLLKTGAAGLSMYFYLRRKFLTKNANLLLSTAYALCAYSIVYQQNIMWLEGVILLPLVIYGIDKILYTKKIGISYALFLGLTLITNYYIGYMICIFSVLYFAASMLGQVIDSWGASFKAQLKHIGKKSANFAIQSLLAGGLAAFLLVPVWFSLQGGKAEFELASLMNEFVLNFSLLDFLSKFVIGAFSHNEKVSGFPNVFVSLFIVILALLFVFNRKINFSSKLKYVLLLGALYFSFKVNFFNLVWHGMNSPTWYPYRYSFIFSFVLILIAAKQIKSRSYPKKGLVSSIIFIFFILLLVYFNNYAYLSEIKLIVTALVVLIWILILWMLPRGNRKLLTFLSLTVLSLELVLNSTWLLSTNNYNEQSDFSYFVTENSEIIDPLKRSGNEFYRIEKNYHYSQNDPLLLGYEGLSHHSSNEKDGVKKFMGHMGYPSNVDYARYGNGSSVPADSFMGVRYLVSDYPLTQYPLLGRASDMDNRYVYENPYYLPLGFHTSRDLSADLNKGNTFAYQNDLFNEVFGLENFFKPIESENIFMHTENLEPAADQEHPVHFEKEDDSEDAYIHYELSDVESEYINFYFDSDLNDGADMYANGNYMGNGLNKKNHSIHVYKTDSDTVNITLKLLEDEIYYDELMFYGHNEEDLRTMKNRAEENKLTIEEFSATNIKGTVDNEEDSTMMLTVPYDSSWKVTVDGEEATTFPVYDTLMGIELPAGSEQVELTFVPKGLVPGFLITLGSGAILIGYYWIWKKKDQSE